MDQHHLDIVRLAWARRLGLTDDALAAGGYAAAVDDSSAVVRFVRIGDAAALVGPSWMVERAAERTLAELLEPATLLGLTHDHSGRCAGPITLGFAIDYTTLAPEPPPLVSHDPADASALESLCPPDDIADAHVSTRDRRFVVLSDEHDPLAGAGYDEFEGFLADTGVLTAPAQRRLGLGATALSLTADDALDQGLIPQLQWHRDNRAARALAERTGFDDVGSYVEVALGRPDNPPPDRPGTQPSEGTGSDD